MTEPSQENRAVTYARDMSQDGHEQINLDGKPRPPELRKLLSYAAKTPRPFEILVIATMPVLGTPSQARSVVQELNELGISVETVDGTSV